MNAPRSGVAFGVDQTGKREFHAWVGHRGRRHGLGTFNAKPEALRIARGVSEGLHQRMVSIAAPGQKGPFSVVTSLIRPEKSVDPRFAPSQVIDFTWVAEAENGGACGVALPEWVAPQTGSYGAVWEATRGVFRAWVGTRHRPRWVGRYPTKAEAEDAAKLAAGGAS